jgi:drug/metabolite transporter (DMT)-like permease
MDEEPQARTRRRTAIVALLFTTVLWGLSFPLGKAVTLLHRSLDPEASGWFVTVSTIWPRFAMAALLLAPFAGGSLVRLRRGELVQGLGLAAFMSAGLLLQMDGLQHTTASTSAFLSQGYVVLVPLVVFARRREWPPPRVVVAVLLVVLGCAVLADVDWRTLRMGRGEAETLLSTVFFTGQILWLERGVFRFNRALVVTCVMFVATALVFLVAAVLLAPAPSAVVTPFASVAWSTGSVCLAVFCTAGALTLMNAFQRRVTATEAGLIYAGEPVWASGLALFLPAVLAAWGGFEYANESMTLRLALGGTLICAANVAMHLRWVPRRRVVGVADQ